MIEQTLTKPQLMPVKSTSTNKSVILGILSLFWLLSNLSDRLWLSLDRFPPQWDQSNHLSLSLRYLQALQTPDFLSGEWWRSFWMVSTKYPPLTYLLTTPFQQVLGTGSDQALWVNLFFSGLLIVCVYTLGRVLFNPQVGLWSAGICLLFPRLYSHRLEYLLDTPITALTIAGFCSLTLWKLSNNRTSQWIWTGMWGISWGLILLTKQSGMFFLFIPLLWVGISSLWQRKWARVGQLIASFFISALLWFPWYRTNWIYLFSTAQNSVVIPAANEGDPMLNTLAAWTYYWQDLPSAITWSLLIIPLVGLGLHLLKHFPTNKEAIDSQKLKQSFIWLAIYLISAYLICSANVNKDTRYIMPVLPILGIILSYCLLLWRGRCKFMRWVTIGLAILAMIGQLYMIPVISPVANILSPNVPRYPKMDFPQIQPQLIQTVLDNAPYQQSNLGVIPNVTEINHNNISYYGMLRDFQVYGRELGTKPEEVKQDGQSMDWFVTKEGGETGFAREAQLALGEQLKTDPNFKVLDTWSLPDQSLIKLYHRNQPTVTVNPLSIAQDQVKLDQIIVPETVPNNAPIPVTYYWSGQGESLENGIIILTWKSVNDSNQFWIHDHGVGMGTVRSPEDNQNVLQVIEQTAMLPDSKLADGDYILEALYLNRQTGETYPIDTPSVKITLDKSAPSQPAPPLDFVTQLRQLSTYLPLGVQGLEPVFQQVDRLNQYDPIHDYLKQAQAALHYRLDNNPQQQEIPWLYNLALSYVLQENAKGATDTLKILVDKDNNNPYSHAYLAFVHLYQWQPKAAEKAVQPALTLAPDVPEIQGLEGIAALMQGNLIKAWRIASPLLQ
ncbi:MAG: phospholipid carrier-dependent glycosyltransferase [Microcystaceae cyanobacterium]